MLDAEPDDLSEIITPRSCVAVAIFEDGTCIPDVECAGIDRKGMAAFLRALADDIESVHSATHSTDCGVH